MKTSHLLKILLASFFLSSPELWSVPLVKGLNPVYGSIKGGDKVLIAGEGFTEDHVTVRFGALPAASYWVNSDDWITAIAPANLPCVVDVTVTSDEGTSPLTEDDRYAFTGGNWSAFIADNASDLLYISENNSKLLHSHSLLFGNGPISITPDGKIAYVLNHVSKHLIPVDVLTQTFLSPIHTQAKSPVAIVMDPTGKDYIGYTVDDHANRVAKMNLSTGEILQTFFVGTTPTAFILTSPMNPKAAYVTTARGSIIRIDFIDNTTTTISTGTGSVPSNIILSPDGATAYFIDSQPQAYAVRQLLHVNTENPKLGFSLKDPSFNFSGNSLPQMAISPDGTVLYITQTGSTLLTAIDICQPSLPHVLYSFDLNESDPTGLTLTADGTTLYVSHARSKFISLVSGLPHYPHLTRLQVGVQPIYPILTSDQAPLASFRASSNEGAVGNVLTFDASTSVSPVGTIENYAWDFGDGNTATGKFVSHTYTAEDFYIVTLIVTNSAGTSDDSTSVYNGRSMVRNGGASAQATLPVTITQNSDHPTLTSLTSSSHSSHLNDSVTFTAQVIDQTDNDLTPLGAIQFTIDGVEEGNPIPLQNGQATLSINLQKAGSHDIGAFYQAESLSEFSHSIATPLSHEVTPHLIQTILKITPTGQATEGTTLTFHVTVKDIIDPQLLPNGGTLQLIYTTASNPIPTTFHTESLNHKILVLTFSAFPRDTYQFYAHYFPGTQDLNHTASSSIPQRYTLYQGTTPTVSPLPLTLTSLPNPSTFGQPLTLNATLNPSNPTSAPPTGKVIFTSGTTTLGTGILLTMNGITTATFSTTILPVGIHSITATYQGDHLYNTSISPTITQQVKGSPTLTTVTSALNPSRKGQPTIFTATVTSASKIIPPGTVQFTVNGKNWGDPVTLDASGKASSPLISTFNAGLNSIQALYQSTDNSFLGSTGSFIQRVLDATETTLTVSSTSLVFGESLLFSAQVTSKEKNPTHGTVQFIVDGVNYGPAISLKSDGTASLNTLFLISSGIHQVMAVYSGDSNLFQSSTSKATHLVVTKNKTITTVTSSTDLSTFNQIMTFTATVTSQDGKAVPTGNVTFSMDDHSDISLPLINGEAVFSTTPLLAGDYSIVAAYSGDVNFLSSTHTLSHVVEQAETLTTLTLPVDFSASNGMLTFLATVTSTSSEGETPTGSVTFIMDEEVESSVDLVNGEAIFQTSPLSIGSHTIRAIYSGDLNYLTSSDSLEEAIPSVDPARDLEVIQVKRRVSNQIDVINIISFKAPATGSPPLYYQIYRDHHLKHAIAKIDADPEIAPADQIFSYKDHQRQEGHSYHYYIVSVDSLGNVSEPAKVFFKGKHK